MEPEEVEAEVMKVIDRDCSDMSVPEYRETLQLIIDSLEMRLEASEADL